MSPIIAAHLLFLARARGLEIASNIRNARTAGFGHSPEVAGLMAEQLVNGEAVAELQDALQLQSVAA